MKTVSEVVRVYQCEVCKSWYQGKKQALTCEKMPVEEKKHKLGSRVKAIEQHECNCGRKYLPEGKIVRVLGPEPFDYEYETKWLRGRGVDTHVFVYEVNFSCPKCHDKKSKHFYYPEIAVSKKAKKK